MSIFFEDFEEYEKMGRVQKEKPHLKNLARERQEREREAEARLNCIHPHCRADVELGEVGSNPDRPWVGTGLCAVHYHRHIGSVSAPPYLKKRESRAAKRAVYTERQLRSGNV